MIHEGEDPFATPAELRDPARRLRGRLASPVTAWTSYDQAGEPVGITVGSVVVNEGEPARVIALIDPLSSFWDAVSSSRRFVMHVLDRSKRRVADQLAGRYPGPDARWENVTLVPSAWGPVLADVATRAYCTLSGSVDGGESLVVTGTVDELELGDDTDPLVYYRGAYHDLRPRNAAQP